MSNKEPYFEYGPADPVDKRTPFYVPGGTRIEVDTDDYDEQTTNLVMGWIVKILNENWEPSGAAKAVAEFEPNYEDEEEPAT